MQSTWFSNSANTTTACTFRIPLLALLDKFGFSYAQLLWQPNPLFEENSNLGVVSARSVEKPGWPGIWMRIGRQCAIKKTKRSARMVPPTFACYCGESLIHAISEHEPGLSCRMHPPLSTVNICHVRVNLVAKKSPLSFYQPKEVLLDDKNSFR